MSIKDQFVESKLPPMVSITVDRLDRIIAVSDTWEAVASIGGVGQALKTEQVLGKSLDSYICGDNAILYIDACLKLCRIRNQTLFRDYRCDSPTHKRFMQMEMVPLPQKAVEMNHFLIKEEPFESPVNIKDVSKLTSPIVRGVFQYVRCSMCNALKSVGSDQWIPPEELTSEQGALVNVIHSVCPACKVATWHPRK